MSKHWFNITVEAFSILAAALVTYSVTLGLGRHTAAVVAEFGQERLTLSTKWQILGYRTSLWILSMK
jgi:hypothetical protein